MLLQPCCCCSTPCSTDRTEANSMAAAAVPAYRAIPGTPFLVDAFRHRPVQLDKVYFLTHAHSGEWCSVGVCWVLQKAARQTHRTPLPLRPSLHPSLPLLPCRPLRRPERQLAWGPHILQRRHRAAGAPADGCATGPAQARPTRRHDHCAGCATPHHTTPATPLRGRAASLVQALAAAGGCIAPVHSRACSTHAAHSPTHATR